MNTAQSKGGTSPWSPPPCFLRLYNRLQTYTHTHTDDLTEFKVNEVTSQFTCSASKGIYPHTLAYAGTHTYACTVHNIIHTHVYTHTYTYRGSGKQHLTL